jgi:hypothetical protein
MGGLTNEVRKEDYFLLLFKYVSTTGLGIFMVCPRDPAGVRKASIVCEEDAESLESPSENHEPWCVPHQLGHRETNECCIICFNRRGKKRLWRFGRLECLPKRWSTTFGIGMFAPAPTRSIVRAVLTRERKWPLPTMSWAPTRWIRVEARKEAYSHPRYTADTLSENLLDSLASIP